MEADPARLWEERPLADGGRLGWQVGPLQLWLERRHGEWRLALRRGADAGSAAAGWLEDEPPADGAELEQLRWAGGAEERSARLRPRLPDRAVVFRGERPVRVLAGAEARFVVGVPLWLDVELRPGGRRLDAGPCLRPSDTWFGPDTLRGELCYASRTALRSRREEPPPRPHRARCELTVVNQGPDELVLGRLRVPVDGLGLRLAADGLRTEDLLLVRNRDREQAEVQALPTVAGRPARELPALAAPRRAAPGGSALKELQAIFGL